MVCRLAFRVMILVLLATGTVYQDNSVERIGGAYRWSVKALEAKQPSFFVAENVNGLGSSGKHNDFQIIISAFERAGYDLFIHKYKFEEYGVPQTRHRLIIVGFRKEYGIDYSPPAPTTKHNPKTSSEALADIASTATNNELTNQSQKVVERLRHIKPGENAFTANLPEHLRLNLKNGATISQIYKRLNLNKPSYTVTGSGRRRFITGMSLERSQTANVLDYNHFLMAMYF